jgi:hypothetical protein
VLANNGSRVGGLAGVDFGTISNAYSTGEVVANGGSNVGGLVGINLGGGGNITSSFWDVQTSGQGGSAGGSGLTTQQAQDPNTLLGLGFNPNNNIWGIVPFGSYPFLLSQFPTPPQVISGTVGSTGVANGAGESVKLAVNGTVIATTAAGANGYFIFLLPSGTIGANSALLAYLTPNTVSTALGNTASGDAVRLASPQLVSAKANGADALTTIEPNISILPNTVEVDTDSATSPLKSSLLTSAAGTLTDPGILYSTTTSGGVTTIAFNPGVNATFANVSGTGGISIDTGLMLSAPGLALGTGGVLSLFGNNNGGSVTQTGAISAPTLQIAIIDTLDREHR